MPLPQRFIGFDKAGTPKKKETNQRLKANNNSLCKTANSRRFVSWIKGKNKSFLIDDCIIGMG
jgi:hypothetical protein